MKNFVIVNSCTGKFTFISTCKNVFVLAFMLTDFLKLTIRGRIKAMKNHFMYVKQEVNLRGNLHLVPTCSPRDIGK